MVQASASRMDPACWWKSYGSSTPQLQQLAMRVLSQPSSAASSEQSWSEYDFVHSEKRNRLKGDIASKLVYVHSNLRLLGRIKLYNRHEVLMATSDLSAAERQSMKLHPDEWDGDCLEEDEINHEINDLESAATDTDLLDVLNSGNTIDPDEFILVEQDSPQQIQDEFILDEQDEHDEQDEFI